MAEKKKNPTKVTTGEGRLSYAQTLFAGEENDEGTVVRGTAFLIPKKDKKTIEAIEAAIDHAAKAGKDKHFNGKIPKTLKTTFYDGDDEDKFDTDEKPETKGMMVLNANGYGKVVFVDADGEEILSADEIYSGAYARLIVEFKSYHNQKSNSRGIRAELRAVQKTRDGDPFGGGSMSADDAADEFGEYEIE